MQVNLTPKFPLGMCVCTPGVLDLMKLPQSLATIELQPFITRHAAGDWGDVHPEDVGANERALEHGSRLMSVYEMHGKKVWVITEADRSVTTVLLPEEY